mmetsp:Transcript_16124/g.44937  ORF Transcript_16124/g.44937 Transcript_16124/m.44937 type:complete len:391 (+) Transcript_16124:418-1590(+)
MASAPPQPQADLEDNTLQDDVCNVVIQFLDQETGLPLPVDRIRVDPAKLAGKKWSEAIAEVVLPGYKSERQKQLSAQGGATEPEIESISVISWAIDGAAQPKSSEVFLSMAVLTPGTTLTVFLDVGLPTGRGIGDTVDIETAKRELLHLEQQLVRKTAPMPDASMGDLFECEWKAQLPKARGRGGGKGKGGSSEQPGQPARTASTLLPNGERVCSEETRAKRAEAGRIGAKKRWERAAKQKIRQQALAAVQAAEADPTVELDPAVAALLAEAEEEEADEEAEDTAPQPEPEPEAIKLGIDREGKSHTSRGLHTAYVETLRPYGAIWFRCRVCNKELAGARSALQHSQSAKCQNAQKKWQEELHAAGSAPKWMRDVFPEAAALMDGGDSLS